MIKTEDGRPLEFTTPISVHVQGHASAKVTMVIDGREVVQTKSVSSNDPAKVSLSPREAGLYKLRDQLWVMTNEGGELVIGRIVNPVLPVGPGIDNNSGGNNPGGNNPGGNNPGGNNPGATTLVVITPAAIIPG